MNEDEIEYFTKNLLNRSEERFMAGSLNLLRRELERVNSIIDLTIYAHDKPMIQKCLHVNQDELYVRRLKYLPIAEMLERDIELLSSKLYASGIAKVHLQQSNTALSSVNLADVTLTQLKLF